MKRRTTQRTAIIEVFQNEDRPLGIEEILERGKNAVASLNQATVYRTIKLLLEQGSLRQIWHPTFGTLYELANKGHHHHFHCRVCNRVYDLPGCPLPETALEAGPFLVEDHDFLLFGVCPGCRAHAENS